MKKGINEIFGLREGFTEQELEEKYRELYAKYSEERFWEGEAGNLAAKRLTEINIAYNDYKNNKSGEQSGLGALSNVDKAIREGDLNKAQEILDSQDERSAEWHYLQAVVYYKKNWHNECKKQLEIAMLLEPNNDKYKSTYDKLVVKIKAEKPQQEAQKNSEGLNWNATPQGGNSFDNGAPQMGGDSCLNMCCELAACNILLNCLCNGCC